MSDLMFLSDEGHYTLERLDFLYRQYTVHNFLYFDLYLNTAYI